MNFLADYGIFLLESLTIVCAILITVAGVIALTARDKPQGKLSVKKLNQHFNQLANTLYAEVLDKKAYKKQLKQEKKSLKSAYEPEKKKYFVIRFDGDIKVSSLPALREEVSAILAVARESDEVVVILDSPGGMVSQYGLAASQLTRIRDRNIPITACIDKVAASGGYLMASCANKILAAPFAMIGSIGVVAQVPNFHRWLKKHDIDVELLTAGEHKRTLTMFGENTEKGRKKFLEDLEDIHSGFKHFVGQYRPQLDLDKVATGEHWLASQAQSLHLVDELGTSDDYLMQAANEHEVFQVTYHMKETMVKKMSHVIQSVVRL